MWPFKYTIIKMLFNINSCFQYLPDKDLILVSNEEPDFYRKFSILNENLNELGFTINDRTKIYMILSAILNLGNIEFESLSDDDSCNITVTSRIFLCNAAALLGTNERELADSLTSITLGMCNQQIKYSFNPPELLDV